MIKIPDYRRYPERILCKCGCGNLTPLFDNKYRPRKGYVSGHNSDKESIKNCQTEKAKLKRKNILKLLYKNGRKPTCYWTGKKQPLEMIERRNIKIIGKKRTPEQIMNISLATKGKYIGIKNHRFGKHLSEETKKKIADGNSGEKSGNWRGGASFEPYGLEFNKTLRKQIRERDNCICQDCGKKQDELFINRKGKRVNYKLHVHHIDFNKKNNVKSNLISLCKACHAKTVINVSFYIYHYTKVMEARLSGQS